MMPRRSAGPDSRTTSPIREELQWTCPARRAEPFTPPAFMIVSVAVCSRFGGCPNDAVTVNAAERLHRDACRSSALGIHGHTTLLASLRAAASEAARRGARAHISNGPELLTGVSRSREGVAIQWSQRFRATHIHVLPHSRMTGT